MGFRKLYPTEKITDLVDCDRCQGVGWITDSRICPDCEGQGAFLVPKSNWN